MSRIVYVNGEYLAEEDAKISVFDRGFLFADGVYEVTSVLHGRLIDNPNHVRRLHRSLDELGMPAPISDAALIEAQRTLVTRNGLEEGIVYLQVTRGAADREFAWPHTSIPSLVMFTQAKTLLDSPQAKTGIRVATCEDIRWHRRDIKTVGLLAACMAKMEAQAAGADDAWMLDQDGLITEGSSNNAYILTHDDVIITRQLGHEILSGITRKAILALAQQDTLTVEERPFSVEEALQAKEAFISSASSFVWPVTHINDQPIGAGTPGPVAKKLRLMYIETALASADD